MKHSFKPVNTPRLITRLTAISVITKHDRYCYVVKPPEDLRFVLAVKI